MLNYVWNRYYDINATWCSIEDEIDVHELYSIYELCTLKFGTYKFKVPQRFELDPYYIRNYIEAELRKLPFIDVSQALYELNKLYCQEFIGLYHKVEENEYKHYRQQLKPYKTVYKVKIPGNGYFKGIELELLTINKEYFEEVE